MQARILLHHLRARMTIRDTVSRRFLEIDPKAWVGVEKTAASSDPKHHIGAVRMHRRFRLRFTSIIVVLVACQKKNISS